MTEKKTIQNGKVVAVFTGSRVQIVDAQSALELALHARYELGADRIAVGKALLSEDFFALHTGLAGEILQKMINYQMKFAVFGDYSGYKSKPLHDFIYESNRGKDIFFALDEDDAVRRLTEQD